MVMKAKLRMYICSLLCLQKKLGVSDPFHWAYHAATVHLFVIMFITIMLLSALFFPAFLDSENAIYILILIPVVMLLVHKLVGDKGDLVKFYGQNIEEIERRYVSVLMFAFMYTIAYFVLLLVGLYLFLV